MRTQRLLKYVCVGAFGFLAACSSTNTNDSTAPKPLAAGYGRLAVSLVDAPNREVKEINVTIRQVTAHSPGSGWVTVMSGPSLTVDLLTLQDRSMDLGFADLPPGKVTQIRLYVDEAGPNFVVLPDGSEIPLKVPSGIQSGIKIKGPFDVSECATQTVTIDFDGKKSIHVHPKGNGEEWVLRPVIHTKKQVAAETPCSPDAEAPGTPDGGSTPDAGGEAPGETPEGAAPKPAGESCTEDVHCLSSNCGETSICEKGGAGAPCAAAGDCLSGACQEDATCAPGAAAGAGSSCDEASDCLSDSCVEGTCQPGGQGSACAGESDCATGFSCQDQSCGVIIG